MFVVCGEALLDVFSTGSTPVGISLDGRIGGSPLNVAIGLARLGQPVAFLGGVSTGFVGERLLKALRDDGVDLSCVALLDAPATLGLVGLDERGHPSYAFYGEGCADRLLQPEHLAKVPAAARVFQFGSYAMVVEPTGSTQRALVERERGRSLITYDPNVRLNVEPKLEVWRDTVAWMAERCHLLKVSDEDLGLLYPGQDMATLARGWLHPVNGQGPSLVVITRGGEGALAFRREAEFVVPTPQVNVVDTVGAGDTFQAAMLTALAERGAATPAGLAALPREAVEACLTFAARAAAITCSRRGADLPRRAELA